MLVWIIIMYATMFATGAALLYLSNRLCRFAWINRLTKNQKKYKVAASAVLVFGAFAIIGWLLNFMNAIVCAVYFAMVWLICDVAALLIQKLFSIKQNTYYAGMAAIFLSILALCYGWYLDHHVWQTEYNLTTSKNVPPLKVAMFADSHIGTTFNAEGFAKHMAAIQAQNPDMLIIAGDFVDDDTSKADMVAACQTLGKMQLKYGAYFVFGNHDNGYYGPAHRGFSGAELVEELEKNGVEVLRDESVLVDNSFYIIGRRDFSVEKEQRGSRLSMRQLLQSLDADKYMIVADHQPEDYANQAVSGADLVLSGHTHGGQLFPFNQVGKWIGANDRVYGHEKRNNTDFIVTSGISDWASKFKTGTKSEYVIVNINKKLDK